MKNIVTWKLKISEYFKKHWPSSVAAILIVFYGALQACESENLEAKKLMSLVEVLGWQALAPPCSVQKLPAIYTVESENLSGEMIVIDTEHAFASTTFIKKLEKIEEKHFTCQEILQINQIEEI